MSSTTHKKPASFQATSFNDDLQAVRAAIHRTPETLDIASTVSGVICASPETEGSSYSVQINDSLYIDTPATQVTSVVLSASKKLHLAQDFAELILQRRDAFEAKLSYLETLLGGFQPGWKAGRVALLEQVWIDQYARDRKDAQAVEEGDHISELVVPQIRQSSSALMLESIASASDDEETSLKDIVEDTQDVHGRDGCDDQETMLMQEKRWAASMAANTTPMSKLPVLTSRPSSTRTSSAWS